MSSDTPALRLTTIAWDTHVGLAKLSARLVSYVSTKAIISAFRFAMKHSSSKACQNLPEEMLLMIAHDVRQMGFQLESEKWDDLTNLLMQTVDPWGMVSQEIIDKKLNGEYRPAESHRSLGVWFPVYGWGYRGYRSNSGQRDVECYHKLLASGDSASTLSKCIEVNLPSQTKIR